MGWTMQSGAATAWVTDELPAGSGRAPGDDAADSASTDAGGAPPPAEVRRGGPRAALLDQLIVRHAMWRAAGVIVGVAVMVGAGSWSRRGALVIAGALTLTFAAYLAGAMAETSFRRDTPDRRIAGGAWREARAIWRHGAALTLRRRMLLGVVSSAVIAGFADEAIERLDTLRLVTLGLPGYDGGEAVVFFGVVWFVMAALSIPVMVWLRRRLATPDTPRDARLLVRLLAVAGIGALALAISPIFALALAGWTILDVAGETTYPLAEAMANREASSGVRATVISFLGQAEALGRVLGGVTLGLVAQFVSVPVALAAAAGLLAVAAVPVAVVTRAQPEGTR